MKKDADYQKRFEAFTNAVREARQYVRKLERTRFIIAEIAMRVCDYSHGGRKPDHVFSLSRFANEIDLDRKTLYEWCRMKRLVVDKLPKTIKEKIHVVKYADLRETLDDVTPKEDPKVVYEIFKKKQDQDPHLRKFRKYAQRLSAILYNINRPLCMKDVSDKTLNDILSQVLLIKKGIEKELQLRVKYKTMAARYTAKPTKQTITNEINEALDDE